MARTRYLNKKSLAETLALFVDGLTIHPRQPKTVAVEDSLVASGAVLEDLEPPPGNTRSRRITFYSGTPPRSTTR